jgi:hypothetical protein
VHDCSGLNLFQPQSSVPTEARCIDADCSPHMKRLWSQRSFASQLPRFPACTLAACQSRGPGMRLIILGEASFLQGTSVTWRRKCEQEFEGSPGSLFGKDSTMSNCEVSISPWNWYVWTPVSLTELVRIHPLGVDFHRPS